MRYLSATPGFILVLCFHNLPRKMETCSVCIHSTHLCPLDSWGISTSMMWLRCFLLLLLFLLLQCQLDNSLLDFSKLNNFYIHNGHVKKKTLKIKRQLTNALERRKIKREEEEPARGVIKMHSVLCTRGFLII